MKARLPKGMGGGPQNMNAMMRQVQQFQEEREALAAELEEREYEVSSGGGAVKLKMKGSSRVEEIVISPEVSELERDRVRTELSGLRERVLKGEKFSMLATLYSQDPGSTAKGGELGFSF